MSLSPLSFRSIFVAEYCSFFICMFFPSCICVNIKTFIFHYRLCLPFICYRQRRLRRTTLLPTTHVPTTSEEFFIPKKLAGNDIRHSVWFCRLLFKLKIIFITNVRALPFSNRLNEKCWKLSPNTFKNNILTSFNLSFVSVLITYYLWLFF